MTRDDLANMRMNATEVYEQSANDYDGRAHVMAYCVLELCDYIEAVERAQAEKSAVISAKLDKLMAKIEWWDAIRDAP